MIVIAGPNGSGKTTFARKYLKNYLFYGEFVNADLISQGISPLNPEKAAMEAGKLMLRKIKSLAVKKIDFSFETTLAGRAYLNIFREIRKNGYRIDVVYLYIPAPDFSIQRIRERVKHGGHNVEDADVRRRFYRGLYNLFNVYWDIADGIEILDNSGLAPETVASKNAVSLRVFDALKFDKMKEMSRL